MTKEEYSFLIKPYEDAMSILLTKLDILNHSSYNNRPTFPISNIQNRIKTQESLERKLSKKKLSLTVENAREHIRDIAGIRVVCYFQKDIYELIRSLKSQSDMVVCVEKDYIEAPKPNGYRSYHLILGIPVYCTDGMEYFPVEIQFRTISMDLWASMEHKIVYKQNKYDDEGLCSEVCCLAEQLHSIGKRFEELYMENK